jgi:hypothetical protein
LNTFTMLHIQIYRIIIRRWGALLFMYLEPSFGPLLILYYIR